MTFKLRLSGDKYIEIDVRELSDAEASSVSPDDIVSIANEESDVESESRGIGRYVLIGAAALGAIVVLRRVMGGEDEDGGADIEIDAEEATA